MNHYVAKNPRGNAHLGWTQEPWTCPQRLKPFLAGGKGPHMLWCGIDCAARFWSYVEKGPDCWLWKGAKHIRGYGACGKQYGDTRAHRVSWLLTHGSLPDEGQGVLDRCNNMLCVNPDHLYPGDQKQNAADCIAAGRKSDRNTPLDQLLHPQLSKRIVESIRRESLWSASVRTGVLEGPTRA